VSQSNGSTRSPIDSAVRAFLEDSTIQDKPEGFTSTAELVAAARQWCDERGEYRFGARALAQHLRKQGYLKWNNGRVRGWRGVRLR
jgi:hypothetical protein